MEIPLHAYTPRPGLLAQLLSAAWLRGTYDHRNGVPLLDNPFPEHALLADQWRRAWSHADVNARLAALEARVYQELATL